MSEPSTFRLPGLSAGTNGTQSSDAGEDIPDFSVKRPRSIKFKIDGEVFEAVAAIGATVMNDVLDDQMDFDMALMQAQRFADGQSDKSEMDQTASKLKGHVGKIMTFLDEVLVEESRARFADRLRSKTNPIDLTQVYQAYHYLVNRYSNRPTVPSSSSTNGHETTGTSLTAGAPPAA